ncbi:MAG: hypothetical protein GF372_13485 [Candidatus Marinimicrobia bacterium]|nr:hypothetical protein [Candidatus Neomarinimicrobiota bacterium]
MNILLSIIAALSTLVLLFLIYPVKYAFRWHHRQDEKHHFEFRLVLFSGLFGVEVLLTGLEKSFRFILFGQSRKIRKRLFWKQTAEAEPPEEKRSKAPARIKKARNLMRKFTKNEILHLIRLIFRHTWQWAKPRSYSLQMAYGLSNPAETGMLYGFICALGIMDFDKVDIEANYLHPELTGNANIYGNLIIGGIFLRTFVIALVIAKILLRKKVSLSPAFLTFSQ